MDNPKTISAKAVAVVVDDHGSNNDHARYEAFGMLLGICLSQTAREHRNDHDAEKRANH